MLFLWSLRFDEYCGPSALRHLWKWSEGHAPHIHTTLTWRTFDWNFSFLSSFLIISSQCVLLPFSAVTSSAMHTCTFLSSHHLRSNTGRRFGIWSEFFSTFWCMVCQLLSILQLPQLIDLRHLPHCRSILNYFLHNLHSRGWLPPPWAPAGPHHPHLACAPGVISPPPLQINNNSSYFAPKYSKTSLIRTPLNRTSQSFEHHFI